MLGIYLKSIKENIIYNKFAIVITPVLLIMIEIYDESISNYDLYTGCLVTLYCKYMKKRCYYEYNENKVIGTNAPFSYIYQVNISSQGPVVQLLSFVDVVRMCFSILYRSDSWFSCLHCFTLVIQSPVIV